MNYPLIKSTWGKEELQSLEEVIASGWFTCGAKVSALENDFAKMAGSQFAVMSNSGSSANLLSIASFFYSKKPLLQPGDEVIVPAIGWSTTYSPLHQYGLKLKFVDIDLNTLNIDLEKLKSAISPKTKMIVAVNILGNPAPLDKIQSLCEEHNILLFEDNCESMGATLNDKWCGRFGRIGTFSTFFSHHISTIEGGFSITDDEELYKILLCLRSHGWSRALPNDTTHSQHYNFLYPGYNLRPNELSAAVGIEQLKKFPDLLKYRKDNAEYFTDLFKNDPRFIIQKENGKSSWFSFAITLNPKIKKSRDNVINELKEKNIESRMVTGGNFVRHPVIKYFDYECHDDLSNADIVHDRGFFVGNYSSDARKEVLHLYNSLDSIIGESWNV